MLSAFAEPVGGREAGLFVRHLLWGDVPQPVGNVRWRQRTFAGGGRGACKFGVGEGDRAFDGLS
ncbi:MAG: hypothetical protein A2Y93_12190 [Chloroflexi bacterium RBG_13_68_17]|nr:MAG: hypothetical protein A2Y93_12190 [Chloroflexi bacterium RBG_13_68_17]